MSPRILAAALSSLLWITGATADEIPSPGNLLQRSRWATLDIIGGRIALSHVRLGQQSMLRLEDSEHGISEVLHMAAQPTGKASLRYEYSGQEQHWRIETNSDDQLLLERKPLPGAADPTYVRYWQPMSGPVSLAVDDGRRLRRVEATSFWHLGLVAPELCGEYLFPTLKTLRPTWHLEDRVQRIELEMLRLSRDGYREKNEHWRQWIDRLASPDFQKRQAAHRQLLDAGQQLMPFLTHLDESRLNAEQRSRIRRIRKQLTPHCSDSPMRVALWLAGDRQAWLALLDRERESTRIAAANHLEALEGEPLDFNPQGNVRQRTRQLAELRRKWGLQSVPVIASFVDSQ